MVFASAHILLGADGEETVAHLVPPGASKEPIDGGFAVTAEFATQGQAAAWLGQLSAAGRCTNASIWSDPLGEPLVVQVPRGRRVVPTILAGPGLFNLSSWGAAGGPSAFVDTEQASGQPERRDSIAPTPPLPQDPQENPAGGEPAPAPAAPSAAAHVAGLAMKPPDNVFGPDSPEHMQQTAAAALAELAADQRAVRRSLFWATSREHALFESLDDDGRIALATTWLQSSAGLDVLSQRVAKARAEEAEARADRYLKFNELVAEVVKDRKVWRLLAPVAVLILIVALVVAYQLTTTVIGKIGPDGVTGWEAAVLVFVFALVAISPVVLLLLERPLAGIDAWSPSGAKPSASGAEEEKPKEDESTEKKKK